MDFILEGYTGYAYVAGNKVLLTSYSMSISENIIESSGIGNILNSSKSFSRYKLNAVRDYPTHDVTISFEAQKGVLKSIFEKINASYCSYIDVSFYDDVCGISWETSGACLTSFTLSVDLNSAATVSLGLSCYYSSADVSFGSHDISKKKTESNLVGRVLMPYYSWGVSYPFFTDSDLCGFSISYSRSVTPKFGCTGSSSTNADSPAALIFGLPTVTYELTYLVYNKTTTKWHSSINANAIAREKKGLNGSKDNNLIVKYNKGVTITLSKCYPNSYSPQFGNASDANKITVSGTCYGLLKANFIKRRK